MYHCSLPPPPQADSRAPAVLTAVILTATWPSTWLCPVPQLQRVDNATEITGSYVDQETLSKQKLAALGY